MLFHLARLSTWRAGLVPSSEPEEDAALRWAPDETVALELANALFPHEIEPIVALVVDEDAAGGPGPIEPKAVTEVRYLRRAPAGGYLTVERRPLLAEALDLYPHPEGGWFRETWVTPVDVAPDGYEGTRATATAIYFLLPPGSMSCWHLLRSDELWLWQRGGPLELRLGGSGDLPGEVISVVLGPDVESGQALQAVVPAGTWQSAEPAGDTEVLLTTVVSPGFHFADFRTP
jgi:predicted cupin superfamily sugar epimerase